MTDAYTRVTKPTSYGYTNVNPQGRQQYDQADISYDDASVFYDGVNETAYTTVAKPTSSVYTKIAKPTT